MYKEPLVGIGGAATGLVAAELPSEYLVRTVGYAGWKKAIVKTVAKSIVGSLLYMGGDRIPRHKTSLFLKVAGLTGLGSIVLDWISLFVPGGLTGIAEKLAKTTRMLAVGVTKINEEMKQFEKTQKLS